MYSNAQKLSAVLAKWLEPVISQLGGGRLMAIPALNALQNKIRSTGWVSPNWSIIEELSPIITKVGGKAIEPIIMAMVSQYPDKDLPMLAHNIVDTAIANGELSVFEGNIVFNDDDLQGLKKLLNYNLPIDSADEYVVKTDEPNNNEES